jgi:microcin C transport system substrate-binding protein
VATRALDRVLRSLHVWVPQLVQGRPQRRLLGRLRAGPMATPRRRTGWAPASIWWWDDDKAQALRDAGAL